MKTKIISCLIVVSSLFLFNSASAQWTLTPNTATTTNNVGIGVTNPQSILHTFSTNPSRTTITDQITLGGTSSGGTPYLGFGQAISWYGTTYKNQTPRVLSRIFSQLNDHSTSTNGTSLAFQTTDVSDVLSTPTTKMIIQYDGKVGIGITSPAHLFQVNNSTPNSDWLTRFTNGTVNVYLAHGSGYGIHVNTNNNSSTYYALQLYNGKDHIAYFRNDGFVGIGTPAPNFLLHVKKDQTAYTYIAADNAGVAGPGAGSGFAISENNIVQWYMRGERDGSGHFHIGTGSNNVITITPTGNVGIGMSDLKNINPNNYKLAVNGTIGAKAVKVEINQTPWPDYVFENDYKMKTISELEAFINTNKHLPNVPSACEVENNGIDMATMDATLLAKIEELSLYIIEQNNKLEAQNKRIEILEKK